jgi:hypothetical protein
MAGAPLSGGKAWFVRRPGRWCGLAPAAREGHARSSAYMLFVTGVAWFLAERRLDPGLLVSAILLVLAATFLFAVIALRMSAPATAAGKEQCR